MLTWSVPPCRWFSGWLIGLGTDRYPFFSKFGVRGGCELQLLDAFDYHLLARLQAFGDDPIWSHSLADLDRTEHSPVFRSHNDDLILRLDLDDGGLGNEQRVLVLAGLDANTAKAAGSEEGVFVGKLGNQLNGARTSRNLAIYRDEVPGLRIDLSVGLNVSNRSGWPRSAFTNDAGDLLGIGEIGTFADVEVRPDRIDLRNDSHF